MEQTERIEQGILKFSSQKNIQEAEDFLKKLKEEGSGNAAYLKKITGQPLRAMEMYKNAYRVTEDWNKKKEILLAMERIQKSLKEDVKKLNNEEREEISRLVLKKSIPSAMEAGENTSLVEVEIDKCRDPYGFGFEAEGWHPFVETLKEIEKNPKIKYPQTALKRFYYLFSPGSLPEALGQTNMDFTKKVAWSPYPWGDVPHQGKLHAVENKEHPRFHALTDNVGSVQFQTLTDHYQLLADTGYHPEAFDPGYIKGVVLKKGEDYRFAVYEGVELVAALGVLGYTKIRCQLLRGEGSLGVADIEKINKWPQVENRSYTEKQAAAVFDTFFHRSGRERAVAVHLLPKELPSQRKKRLEALGVDMSRNTNVNFYNAGWLNRVDPDFVKEVQQYWQKHYGKTIDPGLHLAYQNLTGKKEVRLIPHEIMKDEIIPLSNDEGMSLVGYNDKNIYDKLISTPRRAHTILRRVCGKYFDQEDHCLNREEAFALIRKANRDLIIKPSTANDGIGVAKLSVRQGEVYRGEEKITLFEIEQDWERDFMVQEVIRQHPVMARPHPKSINALRMITFRWKNEIKNLMTVAFFGGGGRIQNNVDSLGCGVSESGELADRIFDKNGNVYTRHPSTDYSFEKGITIPNYSKFKKFVRDLHKEVYHQDYICWDIVVGEEGEPIFLEFNFWGTTWFYQLVNETPFFGDDTEEVLEFMAGKRGLL